MNARRRAAVAHHPVVRGRRRQVGEAVIVQRLQQPLGVEAAGERADGDAERERRERAVPQAVAPRRRRRAEEAVARPEAGAVQRGEHQRDERAMRVLDRRGQLARGAGRVLEDRRGRRRAWSSSNVAGNCASPAMNASSATTTRVPSMPRGHRRLLGVGDQQLRRAVVHAQPDAVGPEQREERHGDRARLHRAEHRDVERARRLEHDGDAVARADAVLHEPVREAATSRARARAKVSASSRPSACARMHRDPRGVRRMPVDALVRDVEPLALAVEQLPQLVGREMLLRVGVRRVVGERGHGRTGGTAFANGARRR